MVPYVSQPYTGCCSLMSCVRHKALLAKQKHPSVLETASVIIGRGREPALHALVMEGGSKAKILLCMKYHAPSNEGLKGFWVPVYT
jgi:hypothetical protein